MFETIRSSPLFSARRLAFTLTLAFLFSFLDWRVVGLLGIAGLREVAANTVVHGLGFYLGYTIIALYNRPDGRSG